MTKTALAFPDDDDGIVMHTGGIVPGRSSNEVSVTLQAGETVLPTRKSTMDAPRDNLTRTVDFTVTRTHGEGDDLTLEGYAAVFNSPTRIDSWEGKFDEIIAPGAFAKTIRDKGAKGIRLQFDHGSHPLIGSIPIGSIQEVSEDGRGLFVKARLSDNWLVEPVRDAIRDGAVDGMSFRFRVVRDDWDKSDEDLPVRTLREVELFEAGPVVWPAYEDTTVGVRAQEIAQQLMDPEQRKAVAAALLTGTPEDAAPDERGTSDEAAEHDDAPPEEGTRRTQSERRQIVRRLFNLTPEKESSHEEA